VPDRSESSPSPITDPSDPRFSRFASFVSAVREKSPRLAPLLERAALCDLADDRLVLGLDPRSFEANFLADPAARELLQTTVRHMLSPGATLEIVDLSPAGREAATTLARTYDEAAKERRREADQSVRNHPLVDAAERFLGAQLKDVRIPE
jgi:hypothetical protein